MTRIRLDTRIEIWGIDYINSPDGRREEDKNAKIIQIERGSSDGDYIVEVL